MNAFRTPLIFLSIFLETLKGGDSRRLLWSLGRPFCVIILTIVDKRKALCYNGVINLERKEKT